MENKRKRKDDLESEIIARQNSIAKFEKSRPFTGSINNDIGTLLATREDRRAIADARKSLDTESQIAAQMRGQDIQKELGIGTTNATLRGQDLEKEIEMRKTAVTEKGYQQNFDVGMGELGLNKDIFKATQDRYKEFGRPSDALNVAKLAADTRVGYEELGLDMPPIINEFDSSYGMQTAKPKEQQIVGEDSIYYNKPSEPEPPEWYKKAKAIDDRLGIGPSTIAMPYAGMSIGKMAGEKIGKGLINLFNPVRNKVRGKVRKVN